jgi:glutamate dehydrogenase (NAD(P)+)
MIPKGMQAFLQERLPQRTFDNRLRRSGGQAFMEFGPLDVDRLARLGIVVDRLGPHLVVCMWDEETELEVGGYLVVDNLAMGQPSMGGIRMLPDVTPSAIHNLARGMTLKNAAADLPYGGGKSGVVASPDMPAEQRLETIRRWARMLSRYQDVYLPGPDVGTNDADMKTIAIESGLDNALSKPADMGGNRIDQLGGAAGGVLIALRALLEEMPRLTSLTQFSDFRPPAKGELEVLIQGFGAVGAHAAHDLARRLPQARVTGISDASGYLYCSTGLPIEELFALRGRQAVVALPFFAEHLRVPSNQNWGEIKFSNQPNDLLRESAFCLVPAAPIANYLDVDDESRPSMTVDHMGRWSVIIEGANTYSPDPARRQARARMERAVYRQRGVLIATDYLVNSGGVIYAAQEHLIRTPDDLQMPEAALGDREAVERWLEAHAQGLAALAEQRRQAAETYREDVIRRNMKELVDLLVTDADMLPCEAAEQLSIRRIAASELHKTASDIMVPIPSIPVSHTLSQAAAALVESGGPIVAVLSTSGALAGVITEWDIARAAALKSAEPTVDSIMTKQVIAAGPDDGLLDIVRHLELHEISAMPVVDRGCVLGMVSSDILARRSLLRLLQSQLA